MHNTGGQAFLIDPVIDPGCPEFVITDGGGPWTVLSGYPRQIEITFTPSALGSQACQISFGDIVPPVEISGTGVEPQYGWEVTPQILDFGYLGTNATETLSVRIVNTGDLPLNIDPSVDPGCSVFTPGSGPFVIERGAFADLDVTFAPDAIQSYQCALDLGSPVPDVILWGHGWHPDVQWSAPTSVDFGNVGVGLNVRKFISIKNLGSSPLEITVSIPDTCRNFNLLSPSTTYEIPPGLTVSPYVELFPIVSGSHWVDLDLGPYVPPITLHGEGYARGAQHSILPGNLNFEWQFVGGSYERSITFANQGGTFIELDVALTGDTTGFTISSGAGPVTLLPGRDHVVQVLFEPLAEGYYAADLQFQYQGLSVPVAGYAETDDLVLTVRPDSLEFLPTVVGQSRIAEVTVINHTHQTHGLGPLVLEGPFIALTNSIAIGGLDSVVVEVEFEPPYHGTFNGLLDLQNKYCSTVPLLGPSDLTGVPGQDQVGIFFDDDYLTNVTHTAEFNQVVQGYLVLLDPTDTSGVSAWELRTELTGEATWLGWQLEGQSLNFGSYEEFIVGVGGPPLPYGPQILLATFQLLVAYPYPSPVEIGLHPIRQPSLPATMVWALGDDPQDLRPLTPFTGGPIVAGINVSLPSDVPDSSTPLVTGLRPNVPNPFNPQTEIRFELARAQRARVAIYDVKGRLMKVLADGDLAAGPHRRVWQGKDSRGRQVPSGVYYVRMMSDDRVDRQKIMLLK